MIPIASPVRHLPHRACACLPALLLALLALTSSCPPVVGTIRRVVFAAWPCIAACCCLCCLLWVSPRSLGSNCSNRSNYGWKEEGGFRPREATAHGYHQVLERAHHRPPDPDRGPDWQEAHSSCHPCRELAKHEPQKGRQRNFSNGGDWMDNCGQTKTQNYKQRRRQHQCGGGAQAVLRVPGGRGVGRACVRKSFCASTGQRRHQFMQQEGRPGGSSPLRACNCAHRHPHPGADRRQRGGDQHMYGRSRWRPQQPSKVSCPRREVRPSSVSSNCRRLTVPPARPCQGQGRNPGSLSQVHEEVVRSKHLDICEQISNQVTSKLVSPQSWCHCPGCFPPHVRPRRGIISVACESGPNSCWEDFKNEWIGVCFHKAAYLRLGRKESIACDQTSGCKWGKHNGRPQASCKIFSLGGGGPVWAGTGSASARNCFRARVWDVARRGGGKATVPTAVRGGGHTSGLVGIRCKSSCAKHGLATGLIGYETTSTSDEQPHPHMVRAIGSAPPQPPSDSWTRD